jgi:hypothetical protein
MTSAGSGGSEVAGNGHAGHNGTKPPAAATAAPATATPAQQGWAVPLLVLIAGMFMSVLDISIVNVAIPTIQNDGART